MYTPICMLQMYLHKPVCLDDTQITHIPMHTHKPCELRSVWYPKTEGFETDNIRRRIVTLSLSFYIIRL